MESGDHIVEINLLELEAWLLFYAIYRCSNLLLLELVYIEYMLKNQNMSYVLVLTAYSQFMLMLDACYF